MFAFRRSSVFPYGRQVSGLVRTNVLPVLTIRSFLGNPFAAVGKVANAIAGNTSDQAHLSHYRSKRVFGWSPEHVFSVVVDTKNYEKFVPYTQGSRVLATDPKTGYATKAELSVGYGPFQESYTSRIKATPYSSIKALSGGKADPKSIFQYLDSEWTFAPGPASGGRSTTLVHFDISYNFRSAFHQATASNIFDHIAASQIEAFATELERRYGNSSLRRGVKFVDVRDVRSYLEPSPASEPANSKVRASSSSR
eukprot:Clim_evm6s232 gene=Clim_evmTU6s232